MPFAVFRRHQKKLLAIFAITAMVGFVLSDSLPALLRSGYEAHRSDTVVATLYGKPVTMADLEPMRAKRNLANAFMNSLLQMMTRFPQPQFFGDTDIRSLVDALILEHEADKLHMPADPELARRWLSRNTMEQMDTRLFEAILSPFRSQNQVTGEQMLDALASQIRLLEVSRLPGHAEVTPLDVYQAYRDRYERVSTFAVRVPVAEFVSQVREPTTSELTAFYSKYKDALPSPTSPTPGFKIPRQVHVEYVMADGAAIAKAIREKLTEEEIQASYESRKSEFVLPPLEVLPESLFADDPKNDNTPPPAKASDASIEVTADTSPRYRPLSEVRAYIETELSQERAREQIDRKFEPVRDVMLDFADNYNEVLEEQKEAKAAGSKPTRSLPSRPDLKRIAAKEGLELKMTPLMDREQAALEEPIGSSRTGTSRQSEGRPFVDEVFAAKDTLYEPTELVNPNEQFFLAWKIADNAPRVPPLSEIEKKVAAAWKLEQARPLAKKAADSIAAAAREAGGKLTPSVSGNRELIVTDPVPKLAISSLPIPGQFSQPQARPSEIPLIPNPSESLREAFFELEPGTVSVAPDKPESAYYVLTLDKRYPVDYTTLYAPSGPRMMLQMEVREEEEVQRVERWLNDLRAEAGLPADWSPPEELENRLAREDRRR